jgi:hypothetical protein
VWNRDTYLKIENTSEEKWAFIVKETADPAGAIPAVSIGSLLRQFNRSEIDILKIDIETSELEVFASNYEEWLPHTRAIMIELHDHWRKGCSKSFFKAINQYDFSLEIANKGKTILCTRN